MNTITKKHLGRHVVLWHSGSRKRLSGVVEALIPMAGTALPIAVIRDACGVSGGISVRHWEIVEPPSRPA